MLKRLKARGKSDDELHVFLSTLASFDGQNFSIVCNMCLIMGVQLFSLEVDLCYEASSLRSLNLVKVNVMKMS